MLQQLCNVLYSADSCHKCDKPQQLFDLSSL